LVQVTQVENIIKKLFLKKLEKLGGTLRFEQKEMPLTVIRDVKLIDPLDK
jgi:hypothetical protein